MRHFGGQSPSSLLVSPTQPSFPGVTITTSAVTRRYTRLCEAIAWTCCYHFIVPPFHIHRRTKSVHAPISAMLRPLALAAAKLESSMSAIDSSFVLRIWYLAHPGSRCFGTYCDVVQSGYYGDLPRKGHSYSHTLFTLFTVFQSANNHAASSLWQSVFKGSDNSIHLMFH
jgi:hypothetical protein